MKQSEFVRWNLEVRTAAGQTDYFTGLGRRPTTAQIKRKVKTIGKSARPIALYRDQHRGGRIVARERIALCPRCAMQVEILVEAGKIKSCTCSQVKDFDSPQKSE